MSQQFGPQGRPIAATVSIGIYLLVKWDGSLCAADANRDWVGVSQDCPVLPVPIGQQCPLRFTQGQTCVMTAAGAITKGAVVYKDANGTVGTTNTNAPVGIALEAASGAGVQFEVLGQ